VNLTSIAGCPEYLFSPLTVRDKAAHYVDKILNGTKPADLSVQQATKFEFIINLKAAKQIGLTIPGRVLERANRVIKWDEEFEASPVLRFMIASLLQFLRKLYKKTFKSWIAK